MFTAEERQRLRDSLVSDARADGRIRAAALTGSGALDAEDRWSDIDLAFGLAKDADFEEVLSDWTDRMYEERGAVHHMDVIRWSTTYRVFLLRSTLQVDLAFSPSPHFGARAPTFRLIFGTADEQPTASEPNASELIGWGWLYALHARSCIERGRVCQAEYMISGLRDHVLALACLRHGVSTSQGRGMDSLPIDVSTTVRDALVRSLDIAELRRAFRAGSEALLLETSHSDNALASRLAGPLRELAG